MLDLTPENVKVRLHRARAALRRDVGRRLDAESRRLYAFHRERCDRIVAGVFARIVSAEPLGHDLHPGGP